MTVAVKWPLLPLDEDDVDADWADWELIPVPNSATSAVGWSKSFLETVNQEKNTLVEIDH